MNLPKHFPNWVYVNIKIYFLFKSRFFSFTEFFGLFNSVLFRDLPCLYYILFLVFFLLFMLFIYQAIKNRCALRQYNFANQLVIAYFFQIKTIEKLYLVWYIFFFLVGYTSRKLKNCVQCIKTNTINFYNTQTYFCTLYLIWQNLISSNSFSLQITRVMSDFLPDYITTYLLWLIRWLNVNQKYFISIARIRWL